VTTAPALGTLLEDWQRRRDLLGRSPGSDMQYARQWLRILDYLIHRYADSPEAQRPAPAPPRVDLQVYHRAIVLLHHLWKGKVGGVKTSQEAVARVSAILERMSSHAVGGESETAAANVPAPANRDDDAAVDEFVWSHVFGWTLHGFTYVDAKIEAALAVNPALPYKVAIYLYGRVVNPGTEDLRAAKLLIQGRNRIALDCILDAWRELTESSRITKVWKVLNRFLARPEPPPLVIERIRGFLAYNNALVRLAASLILGRIGTMEDVGLLNDLLALPAAEDEHPEERAALLHALRTIAEGARWGKG
jgi:hypothetical protein